MENFKYFWLEITNKRLDDLNAQLVDQSRRIDETNQRIDAIRDDLIHRIDATNQRIEAVHSDLITRIDTTNDRLNRLLRGHRAARRARRPGAAPDAARAEGRGPGGAACGVSGQPPLVPFGRELQPRLIVAAGNGYGLGNPSQRPVPLRHGSSSCGGCSRNP